MTIGLVFQGSDVSRVATTSPQCVTSGVPPQLRFLPVSPSSGAERSAGRNNGRRGRAEARSPGAPSASQITGFFTFVMVKMVRNQNPYYFLGRI